MSFDFCSCHKDVADPDRVDIDEWELAHEHVVRPVRGWITARPESTLTIFQKLADGRWILARDANTLTDEKPADSQEGNP